MPTARSKPDTRRVVRRSLLSYDIAMTTTAEVGVSDGREYELKFAIDPSACEALVSHPALKQAVRDQQLAHLTSTYFDTPDERLRREHVSLRVRQSEGGGAVQTLKQASGSIVDRAEWERPVDGASPDPAFLRETPLKPLFEEIDGALAPRFTVDVTRTIFPLHQGEADIEAALDRGTIRAEGLAVDVSELELESKKGQQGAVFDVARELVRDLPLVLSLTSKSERGFAMAGLTLGRPTKALDLTLTAKMTREQAFASIVQACLAAITWNAALIAGENDGEAVHKTRIALRRLRAAIALFKPTLRKRRLAPLLREVKWAARKLGEARDADVLQATHIEPAAHDPLVTGAPALAALMRERRATAHAALRAALASSRWRLLLVNLLAFSLDGVRRSRRTRGYRGFVRGRLAALRGELAGQARRFSRLPPGALHEMRKSAKMLRYDLELFREVPKLGGHTKAYDRLLGDLESLQEILGEVQDGATAREHLHGAVLGRPRPSGTPPEVWRSAASAARLLSRRISSTSGHPRKAEKAARRLRRPIAFR